MSDGFAVVFADWPVDTCAAFPIVFRSNRNNDGATKSIAPAIKTQINLVLTCFLASGPSACNMSHQHIPIAMAHAIPIKPTIHGMIAFISFWTRFPPSPVPVNHPVHWVWETIFIAPPFFWFVYFGGTKSHMTHTFGLQTYVIEFWWLFVHRDFNNVCLVFWIWMDKQFEFFDAVWIKFNFLVIDLFDFGHKSFWFGIGESIKEINYSDDLIFLYSLCWVVNSIVVVNDN